MPKSYLVSDTYVPNEGNPKCKIWLVGEAPGAEEVANKRPFVGSAGNLLESALTQVGLGRSEVYLANLCHYRPRDNQFKRLYYTKGKGKKKEQVVEPELEEGISELVTLIKEHQPDIIVPLGNYPLKLLTSKVGISSWRGSPISYYFDNNILCVPTFHPSYVQRVRSEWPIFINDLSKVVRYSKEGYKEHQFNIKVGNEVSESIVEEYEKADILFCDIESVKESTNVLCVGFALNEHDAISIPMDGKFINRQWVSRLLRCPAKKVFHLGSFDSTVLRCNGFELVNYSEDTIIMSHVLQPELKRSLAFLASIYSDIPYYKQEGKAAIPNDEKSWNPSRSINDLMVYNGKDVCATAAVYYAMLKELEDRPDLMDLYRYEIRLLDVVHHISDAGMLRDEDRVQELRSKIEEQLDKAQKFLNVFSGGDFNVNSSKDMPYIIYDTFGLPKRTKRGLVKGKSKVTTDNDALISLIAICKGHINSVKKEKTKLEWEIKLKFIQNCIIVRSLRKLLSSYINVEDRSGRIHGLYKVFGTETGRLAATKYVDGTGFNPQTTPRSEV